MGDRGLQDRRAGGTSAGGHVSGRRRGSDRPAWNREHADDLRPGHAQCSGGLRISRGDRERGVLRAGLFQALAKSFSSSANAPRLGGERQRWPSFPGAPSTRTPHSIPTVGYRRSARRPSLFPGVDKAAGPAARVSGPAADVPPRRRLPQRLRSHSTNTPIVPPGPTATSHIRTTSLSC
jgi:hypothetical protein